LSFFDDDEETAPRPSPRTPRRRPSAGASAPGAGARAHRPRRPQHGGGAGIDQQTLMVRRGVAAAAAVVLVIVIVLVVNGCLKSEKQQSLKTYNREVGSIAQEYQAQIAHQLFVTLTGAASKSALDVQQQIDELQSQGQQLEARAKALSVPGEMASAQQNLLLAVDLRVEGLDKISTLLPAALGGKAKQTGANLAGAMETFLASDVIYTQRVVPLIHQTLAANGLGELATNGSRFLPNLGWLETNTLLTRIGQPPSSSSQGAVAPGHHGSVLKAVSVGTTALEAEPAVNHVSGGGSPTFTVELEDDGEFPETGVKVDVTVTAEGKQFKSSHSVNTEPGKTAKAEVTVTGIPLGMPAKVEAAIGPVPGETDHEGTKGSFLAIFGE
jgi:hypothetical protein